MHSSCQAGHGGRLARCIALVAALATAPSAAAQSDVAFPLDAYTARRAALSARVGNAVVVAAGEYLINPGDGLVKQDPTFWYLTGVESPYAILLMVPRGEGHDTFLFVPDSMQFAGGQFPMDDPAFRNAVWNRPRRRLAPGPGARLATGAREVLPLSAFADRFRAAASETRAIVVPFGDSLYAPPGLPSPGSFHRQFRESLRALAPGAEWRDLSPLTERLRLVKDRHEIDALRRAAAISGRGMLTGLRALRPGMNDRELAGLMEYEWKRQGSPRASFPPIVSSGENSLTFFSLLRENYNAVDRVMRNGDLVFVDYGAAEYMTYTTDICRTWPVSGRFTAEQRKYYDIVLEAQEAAIAAIRPGVMMIDVIKASARVFEKHGLAQYEDVQRMGVDKVWGIMPSPTHYLTRNAGIVRYNSFGRGVRDLGHHIGLEVQDSRDYSMPLEPGMVITIEPKIYIPEKHIAIMIEDMILVTPQGSENLSAAVPKKASEIERLMR
ncbi:MAG: aminopeptidase P family protein [Gemmatimonadaceae bacterium]|nr:aminopeptidase P family protein [Gemmatimonadaceae bacterium]